MRTAKQMEDIRKAVTHLAAMVDANKFAQRQVDHDRHQYHQSVSRRADTQTRVEQARKSLDNLLDQD